MSLDLKIMKSKKFTPEIWTAIEQATYDAVQTARKNNSKAIAAFDADGTLWNTDLGESFFKYQIKNCPLPAFQTLNEDPWIHYRRWKESGDPRPAYLWLAQINSGQSISKVREWAASNVREMSPLPVFEAQRELIAFLKKNDVEVYVITASVKWSVEAGAEIFGIPEKNVIGVATQIESGIITEKQSGLITYRDGKPAALLEHTNGVRPFLCSGNTTGDLNLLKAATHLALAVQSTQPEGSELFKTEMALQKEAEANNWLRFHFG